MEPVGRMARLRDPRAKPGGYYKYALSVDGTRRSTAPQRRTTPPTSSSQYATDFIATTPADQPLFLYYTPRAPHLPDIPPPRYATACADQTMPEGPSFNEADVSDKPAYGQAMPPLTDEQIAEMQVQWKDDCRSLLAVDDSVGAIVNALDAAGRLSNTMIVYASDNGQFFGEHRRDGKIAPYEEAIRVPIVVRYDPLTGLHAATSDRMVVNIDYAPTWAALAGVAAPGAEGTSFLPLLTDPEGTWRTSFLQEYWGKSAIPSVLRRPDDDVEVHQVRDRRGGAVRPRGRPQRAAEPGLEPGVRGPEGDDVLAARRSCAGPIRRASGPRRGRPARALSVARSCQVPAQPGCPHSHAWSEVPCSACSRQWALQNCSPSATWHVHPWC